MNQWGWAIAAAVLGITLVQLLAYYYLMRGRSSADVWPSSTDGAGTTQGPTLGSAESPFDDGAPEEDVRRCERCGAHNDSDPIYTFCHNCGAELS